MFGQNSSVLLDKLCEHENASIVYSFYDDDDMLCFALVKDDGHGKSLFACGGFSEMEEDYFYDETDDYQKDYIDSFVFSWQYEKDFMERYNDLILVFDSFASQKCNDFVETFYTLKKAIFDYCEKTDNPL